MEASVVDLRYKMKDVLEALERREVVKILYHGNVKGTIIPASGDRKTKTNMTKHPFFGMSKGYNKTVSKLVDELRKERYDAL